MRDYKEEFERRVAFIKNIVAESGVKGIVFGNSGGKDSALVGILCKFACDDTVGVIMPCSSRRNFEEDSIDAREFADKFKIETRVVDLTPVKEAELKQLSNVVKMVPASEINIAPRLRMTTLYAIAACESRLVAGTGNRSETYVGYFTKWGDGAHDFNPISDLTVTEIYEFLRYLDAPRRIIEKAPSAGLYDAQTDEADMGFKYSDLDAYITTGNVDPSVKERIDEMHRRSQHKREDIKRFKNV